ncbi:MAG: DNA polymerase/3'-5' exonuclease PolX [Gemmatimonadaceae bacterium]|nr:DNA polymerase/3'-5' exonuclease PolX [Gemmatimonadaceae bacterium]
MLSPRDAAHILAEIATLLELRGESRAKSRSFESASRALHALAIDDLTPLLSASGERAEGALPWLDQTVVDVLRDAAAQGDSQYLEQLRENTPEGLLEMQRVPGLGTAKIHRLHEGLGIESLHGLEQAARDGRLASLPGFGQRTADKVLRGIANLRGSGARLLYPHAAHDAERLLATLRAHPDVVRAEVAGSLRRHLETVGDIDIVAAVRGAPSLVASAIAHGRGVRQVLGGGGPMVTIRYDDGTSLDLRCVSEARFPLALWWATGSATHAAHVVRAAAARGITIGSDEVRDADGRPIRIDDEAAIYVAAGLPYIAPELREGLGEVSHAEAIPTLVQLADIQGVLHCHSHHSDGAGTIAELAQAAFARGWRYLGVSDHSQSASYAGGLSREAILRQHEEIDGVNASMSDFRVLKGIEADILPCGRVDYDDALLDRFDYVIASVHSRFGMNETQMTDRVLKAMDDPHVTIVGHPTGRLLLTREPYAINVSAMIEKAATSGVAVELNADPHRLDLDWRYLREAHERGARIEIGPDAHSIAGLDHVALGVGIARKGWLSRHDVLNAGDVDEVLAFAAARRSARLPARAAAPATAPRSLSAQAADAS